MTTSNGRVADVVDGIVESVKDRGIDVCGEWRNVSKFHPVDLPDRGVRVRLQLHGQGFIKSLQILDAAPAASPPPAVTVANSRRWTDFEDYLIPRDAWVAEREQHYSALGLPIDSDTYLTQLEARLHTVTADGLDGRGPDNSALTIDRDKGEYHLARLKASSAHDAAKGLNDLLESRTPEVELIDALIDVECDTDGPRSTFSRY